MEEGKIKMAMMDMWMVESARIKVTDSRIMSKVDIVSKRSECLRSTLPCGPRDRHIDTESEELSPGLIGIDNSVAFDTDDM